MALPTLSFHSIHDIPIRTMAVRLEQNGTNIDPNGFWVAPTPTLGLLKG